MLHQYVKEKNENSTEVLFVRSNWLCSFKNCCTFHNVKQHGERENVNEKNAKMFICVKKKNKTTTQNWLISSYCTFILTTQVSMRSRYFWGLICWRKRHEPQSKTTKDGLSAFLSVSHCHIQLFATPRTVAHQAPLSMEFSRQENWIGFPFPSPVQMPVEI